MTEYQDGRDELLTSNPPQYRRRPAMDDTRVFSKYHPPYCACRWPTWNWDKTNTMYCTTCDKTASSLVLELIDDGKTLPETITFNREEFFTWYTKHNFDVLEMPTPIEFKEPY